MSEKFSINEIIDDWYYSNVNLNDPYRRLYNSIEERRELISMLIGRIKELGYEKDDILTSHKARIINKCIGTIKDKKKRALIERFIEEDIDLAIHQYFSKNAFKQPDVVLKLEPPSNKVLSKESESEESIDIEKLNLVTEDDIGLKVLPPLAEMIDHEFCDFLGVPEDHRR
jgi:hypothetical protein